MMPLLLPTPVDISEAARALGKRGGRPPGSYSSPLAIWLREEVKKKFRDGYDCREAFDIISASEEPDGNNAFELTDYTAEQNGIDLGPSVRVKMNYFRKIWKSALY